MNPKSNTRIAAYWEAWASGLALLLSQLTSNPWKVETADRSKESVPAVEAQIGSSQLPGELEVRLDRDSLTTLLGAFLGEQVSISEGLDEVQSEATEELLRQWCGLAAGVVKPVFGDTAFEVTLRKATGPSQDGASAKALMATWDSRVVSIELEMSAALRKFLQDSQPAQSRPQNSSRIEELLQQNNLDLLMDVELSVMLRFGQREVTLREVLDMATGAVLELDRGVQEPVDLVLNGKVIARGEVVVVDGNYGLRVTEVASPQQRVSSL